MFDPCAALAIYVCLKDGLAPTFQADAGPYASKVGGDAVLFFATGELCIDCFPDGREDSRREPLVFDGGGGRRALEATESE